MIDLDKSLNLDKLYDVSNYLSFFEDWPLRFDCSNIYLDNLSWFDKRIGKGKEKMICEEKLDMWFEKENNFRCVSDLNKVKRFFKKRNTI